MSDVPSDATLRDVVVSLDNPKAFVWRCLDRMWKSTVPAKDIVLRVGITGKGVRPNYRLERTTTFELLETIDGNTHDVAGDWTAKRDSLWSSKVMTLAEVTELKRSLEGLPGALAS